MNARAVLMMCICTCSGWWVHHGVIAPVLARKAEAHDAVKLVRERFEEKRSELASLKKLNGEYELADRKLKALFPQNSPLLWLPQRMESHFRDFGLADGTTRKNSVEPAPEFRHLVNSYWAVELSLENTQKAWCDLLLATAALEESISHLKVLDVSVRENLDAPAQRIAVVNFALYSSPAN